jgi:hypothetical protein
MKGLAANDIRTEFAGTLGPDTVACSIVTMSLHAARFADQSDGSDPEAGLMGPTELAKSS